MKITKKIGNKFYTIEDDEIDKFAPSTFKEAFWGTIFISLFVYFCLFMIWAVGEVLSFIFSM